MSNGSLKENLAKPFILLTPVFFAIRLPLPVPFLHIDLKYQVFQCWSCLRHSSFFLLPGKLSNPNNTAILQLLKGTGPASSWDPQPSLKPREWHSATRQAKRPCIAKVSASNGTKPNSQERPTKMAQLRSELDMPALLQRILGCAGPRGVRILWMSPEAIGLQNKGLSIYSSATPNL